MTKGCIELLDYQLAPAIFIGFFKRLLPVFHNFFNSGSKGPAGALPNGKKF